jgi:broad specificity phosphatase PhoE
MAVLVVRHAKAGDRERWSGPDEDRPLTDAGMIQADALVGVLAEFRVERILSSPYLRCTQTVVPLASALGLPVEPTDDLAEGAGGAGRRLVASLTGPADTVLCTHGDVLYDLLSGLDLPWNSPMKKASTWVLEVESGRVTTARYLPPPT